MEEEQAVAKNTYVPQPPLSFTEAVGTCFRKYFSFTGRARGSEYWYFVLFSTVVYIIAIIIDVSLVIIDVRYMEDSGLAGLVTNITLLLVSIPSLSAAARRLHDTGRSGWWQLLHFTGIGSFVVLYWLIIKGDTEKNSYDLN